MLVTHISRALISHRHTAEHNGVTVVFGGRPRLSNTFEQLPHRGIMPLPDQPLTHPDVDCQSLQLEVLQQKKDNSSQSHVWMTPGLYVERQNCSPVLLDMQCRNLPRCSCLPASPAQNEVTIVFSVFQSNVFYQLRSKHFDCMLFRMYESYFCKKTFLIQINSFDIYML